MNNYNHKQFIEWLNQEVEKQQEGDDKLLVENKTKLSKYWRSRAKRRAHENKRNWPNKKDRDWATLQQERSIAMQGASTQLLEKELEESEETLNEIERMMRNIKKRRKEMRLKREAAKQTLDHPVVATAKRKNGNSLSKIRKPRHGGVKKGFVANSKGAVTVAPTGEFGPMEEQKENDNENN